MSNVVGRWIKSAVAEHSQLAEFDINQTKTVGRLQFYVEGLPETQKVHINNTGGPHWIIAGIGIDCTNTKATLVTDASWQDKLSQVTPEYPTDGAYAVIRWDSMRLTLAVDPLEMRRLYWFETNDEFCFSTRLDWLVKLKNRRQLNHDKLSSQIHFINSFSDSSFINDIHRIGAGGRLTVSNTPASISKHLFTPDTSINADIPALLASLIKIPVEEEKRISLGLSGGMDSRALLALMLQETPTQLSVHSFGEENDLDLSTAQELASLFELPLEIQRFDVEHSETNTMNLLRETALQTEMAMPLQLYRLPQLFTKQYKISHWMLDGAFGEYLRRSYGHSILHNYKRELLKGDYKGLAAGFMDKVPAFWSERFARDSRPIAIEQFFEACQAMPFINKNSNEFWLDLLLIRNRIPNFPANGQAWVENAIPTFMPFAQPTILHSLMNLSTAQKRDSKITRKLITQTTPAVKQLPLAKGSAKIPFALAGNLVLSKLGTKLFQNRENKSVGPQLILKQTQEELQDRLSSQVVQSYQQYSKSFLRESLQALKNPMEISAHQADEILKWLAFDFWRELVEGR